MQLTGGAMRRVHHPHRLARREPLPAANHQAVARSERPAHLHHIGDARSRRDVELFSRVASFGTVTPA